MRRLLSFGCEGAAIAASLDEGAGATGLLFVTGGTQTRIGSHRMFERLAKALADHGYPCFRFDRRGVGDSEGEDPGWRGSGPDLAAAAAAFRRQCPGVSRLVGLGLCDGATALAFHAAQAGIEAAVMVNPWLVEAEAGEPPAAAIGSHYRRQLLSIAGWKKILTGSLSYRKVFKGLRKLADRRPSSLSAETAAALERGRLPVRLILATGDATAIAARAEWESPDWRGIRAANPAPLNVDSDSHTFARPGDEAALLEAVTTALAE
jgi:exosortase A-associated hydrolase 1